MDLKTQSTLFAGGLSSLLTSLCSINFNIVSKKLGSDRMSYFINEAAQDMAEVMRTTLDHGKAKL